MKSTDETELRADLLMLQYYVERLREEIAGIYGPADQKARFVQMGDQLNAIVESTEQAAHIIINTVEANETILDDIQKSDNEEDKLASFNKLSSNNTLLLEACSFQDLTGQRINKVIKSLSFVESRIEELVDSWAGDDLEDVVVAEAERTDDEKLLDGPQISGEGVSQSEIDALFD